MTRNETDNKNNVVPLRPPGIVSDHINTPVLRPEPYQTVMVTPSHSATAATYPILAWSHTRNGNSVVYLLDKGKTQSEILPLTKSTGGAPRFFCSSDGHHRYSDIPAHVKLDLADVQTSILQYSQGVRITNCCRSIYEIRTVKLPMGIRFCKKSRVDSWQLIDNKLKAIVATGNQPSLAFQLFERFFGSSSHLEDCSSDFG